MRGDIVLMVVPGELGKPRPGVVVQADELGSDTTTILVCPMSSDVRDIMSRPVVDPTSGNGLRIQSQIMTDKAMPLRRNRIRQVIGRLDDTTQAQLDRALLMVFGLAH